MSPVVTLYSKYIQDKALVWTEASVRSERVRLNRVMSCIDGDAPRLWGTLDDYGAYSRVTLWNRVVAFYDWGIEEGHLQAPNPYAVFRKKNKRRFTNVYERRPPEVTFEEARRRILTIGDTEIRNKCLQLLSGGLRWTESFTLADGYVLGKGNKSRRVYAVTPEGPVAGIGRYLAVLRALKKVGLKPHKLRGIFLSELVRRGVNPFELKKVAGWSSLQTAESYIAANDDNIQKLVGAVQGAA